MSDEARADVRAGPEEAGGDVAAGVKGGLPRPSQLLSSRRERSYFHEKTGEEGT